MLSILRSRRATAELVAVLVLALVVGLGIAVLPRVASVTAASAAEAGECACEEVGSFAAPDAGVAPDFSLVTPDLALSPRGGYELVRAGSTASIYRAGDRSRTLLAIPLGGVDRNWGFSPDDDRFLTWTLGGGQLISWQLYDLTGSAAKLLRDEQGVAASSISFAFSRGGQRLVVGAVSGGNQQRVSVYSATTGKPSFTETAPIPFPAYDPGAGGDSGGPSVPRNVKIEVPKKTVDIEISWDQPHYQGDGAITKYTLEVDPIAPEGSKLIDVADRHVRLTGYKPGVKYTFTLRIVNRWEKKSPPVSVSIKIPLPKPQPSPSPTATPRGFAPDPADADADAAPPLSSPTPDPRPSENAQVTASPTPAAEPSATPAASESPVAEPTSTPEPEPTASPESDQAPEPGVEQSADASVVTASSGFGLSAGRAVPAAVDDPIATSGWGFSPDPAARYVLLADREGNVPRMRVFNAETGKLAFSRLITSPSAEWTFGPCGDVIGLVELTPNFRATYTLLDTATGDELATVQREAKATYGFTVEQSGENLYVYYWADGTGRMLAPVADCGPPPPPPPAAPTGVTATAAIGRVAVSWQHPATDIQEFEVTPYRGGVAQDAVSVDGRQRVVVLGTGTEPWLDGSYTFRVRAVGVGGPSVDSAASAPARVLAAAVCGGAAGTKGPASGTAQGAATSGGLTASFSYEVTGRTVEFRTTSGPSKPTSVLDPGHGADTDYPAGGGTRVERVTYPYWGDYLASVTSTGANGEVSIATAVIHVVPKDSPVNDAFAKAIPLTGTSGAFDADNRWTTCEAGEPGTEDSTLTQWFTYRSAVEGAILLDDMNYRLNAYEGDSLTSLEPIGRRFQVFPYRTFVVPVRADVPVRLQVVASAAAEEPARFTDAWRFVARPKNDDIAKATVIDPTASPVLTEDLAAATVEEGEPDTCEECHPRYAASTWYRWTAVSDAHVWFHLPTTGSDVDLFTADASQPLGVRPAETLWKMKSNHLGLRQETGQTYYVRVALSDSQFALSATTDYEVAVTPAPANDFVRDATSLSGASGRIDGTNAGGWVEVIPERPASDLTRTSLVWYEWTAPKDGAVSFAVEATGEDPILQPEALVFTPGVDGADPVLLAPATLPGVEGWRSARTTFTAQKEKTYLVAVTGVWRGGNYGVTEGPFTLRWGEATVPSAPSELEVEERERLGGAQLSWTLADDGNADVIGYRVTADPALPEGAVIDIGVAQKRAAVYGLLPGVDYELRVAAVNAVGPGAYGAAPVVRLDGALLIDPARIVVEPGAEIATQLIARGGTEPYSFALAPRSDWLSIDDAGTVTGTAPDEPTSQQFVATVTDSEGNQARRVVFVQVGEPSALPIDAELPAPPASGWYDGEVTIVLNATSVTPMAAASRLRAAPVADAAPLTPITWSLTGAHTDSGTTAGRAEITVAAEGETTLRYWSDDPGLAHTLTVRIDTTGPVITITSPEEGVSYPAHSVPEPQFSCTDALSGPVSCEVVPDVAAPLAAGPEDRALVVRAVDAAGNETMVTRAYRVLAASADPGDPGNPSDPADPLPPSVAPASERPVPATPLAATGADAPPFGLAALLLVAGMALIAASRGPGRKRRNRRV